MSENTKNYRRDILLIISTLLAAINLWQPPTPWLRQGKIYVSPQGYDWNLGNSPQRAVKTIQRAANMATPGEEIVILPGMYREDLRVRRGGLIAHTVYQTGLWQPRNWRLPNPGRHAMLVGALTGRNWGAGLAVILTVLWLRSSPR